jgi:non-canonical purine NTP pyrophosphatase (RdgB/HAM1 family)
MEKILIATHNAGKIAELTALLSPHITTIKNARDLNLLEPEETGNSFHENAALKAIAAAHTANIPALADDSGLCVAALDGAPGIYSARWAENKNYQFAIDRIFRELNGADATAEFVCLLALAQPNGETEFFEGRCGGTLIQTPRGGGGFGYDPYFVPEGYDKTFAELGAAVKDKISHRAIALQNLIDHYF